MTGGGLIYIASKMPILVPKSKRKLLVWDTEQCRPGGILHEAKVDIVEGAMAKHGHVKVA